MKNTISKVTLTSAIILSLSPFILASQAVAKQCKNQMVWGYGIHHSKQAARALAHKSWRSQVKASYGASWSFYILAKQKTSKCRKWSKDPSKWNCVKKGKPCRNGPGGISN